jgi:hypothetical protein
LRAVGPENRNLDFCAAQVDAGSIVAHGGLLQCCYRESEEKGTTRDTLGEAARLQRRCASRNDLPNRPRIRIFLP